VLPPVTRGINATHVPRTAFTRIVVVSVEFPQNTPNVLHERGQRAWTVKDRLVNLNELRSASDCSLNLLLTNCDVMKVRSSTAKGLLLLWAIDAVMIGLAILYDTGVLADPRFSLTRERGFSEMVQYAKYGAGAVLLFRAAARGYGAAGLAWGLLFIMLLCEDAFEIHEQLGARVAAHFHLPPIAAMQPGQLGEIVIAAVEGAAFFVVIGATLLVRRSPEDEGGRSASRASRRVSLMLLGGLVALAGFGVVVDAIHSIAPRGTVIRSILSYAEDGGEMIAASLLVWTTWVCRKPWRDIVTGEPRRD
jgi:hypothetical protein